MIGCMVLLAAGPSESATTVSFEAPAYAAGTFASVTSGDTDKPFNGQQGWSQSTANSAGMIAVTSTSGTYAGGLALFASAGQTYIGGLQGAVPDPVGMSIRFDLMFGVGQEIGVGFWNDADGDGRFDNHAGNAALGNAETGAQFGVVADGAAPYAFGLRDADFGQRRWSNGVGALTTAGTGVAGTAGHWYRCAVSFTPNSTWWDVSMAVLDLTTATYVDFDSGLPGTNPLVASLTLPQMGFDPSTRAKGIFVRVTTSGGQGAIDNLVYAIPEPSVVLLAGCCVLGLLHRHRRT